MRFVKLDIHCRFVFLLTRGVHFIDVFGELLQGRNLRLQGAFGILSGSLCPEYHRVVLRTYGRLGQQIIGDYDLLYRTHFYVCFQLGVCQVLACAGIFFRIPQKIISHQRKRGRVQDDTQPTPRSAVLGALRLLEQPALLFVVFICH